MAAYLKYGDIKGDVKEPAYRSWIELSSVQLGKAQPILSVGWAGGSGAERTQLDSLSEVTLAKGQDSASAALVREASAGKPVFAVIDFLGKNGYFLRLEMSETLISSYSASGQGDHTTESLTLSFSKLNFSFVQSPPP